MKVFPAISPKVSVCVITFNHQRYLAACLQSIVDQVANFPFEIVVGDDCSTDGTQDILRNFSKRYPNLIRPIYQSTNTGGGPNFVDVHTAARGEYIAHLDGDDFALPGKLQIQADYLDVNPECHVVWHRVARKYEGELPRFPRSCSSKAPLIFTKGDCLAIGSIAVHSSKMYRSSLRKQYATKIRYQYDYELDLLQVEGGHCALLPEVLGVYRVGRNSLTARKDSRSRKMLDEVLIEHYLNEPVYRGQISSILLLQALIDIKNRREYKWRSAKNFLKYFSILALPYLVKYSSVRWKLAAWNKV